MCSVFRRRIANQIIGRLKSLLIGYEKIYIYDSLPLCIKFNQTKGSHPCFEIFWKDFIKLKPELNESLHLTSLMALLKNQDFPTVDGILSIDYETNNREKIVFTTDQELFTSSVLSDIIARIDEIPVKSTFFKNIPPEIVMVEYSSPNIAKPFHYGHFRSTIMGKFLSNICQYVGHDVTQINYVGDWGLQYGILATGFNEFGCYEKLAQNALGHLYEIYIDANKQFTEDPKFNETARNYFKKMEDGDYNALSVWKTIREKSLKQLQETYLRLKVNFDVTHSESMYFEKAKDALDLLIRERLATFNEDGCIQVNIGENKKESVILRKSDGTTLYLTRDIAAAIERHKKYHFDSMYYVVDSSQHKHFDNLKSILKSLKFTWESNIHHVPFGRILNFSTRKGNAIFLHDILDEARHKTLEKMHQSPNTKVTNNLEAVADILGISSLIINDFSCKRKRDIHFNWETALNITGDSGVSLQYCYARLCSIKENCGFQVNSECELTSLVEPEAISLIAQLAKFDEIIYNAYRSMEPCVIVHYLFTLKHEIGKAIKVLPVKGSSSHVARARLLLFYSAQLVLRKSLELLGITPLQKM